ncbi:MAG: leucine-rich repeat domain-containing protein [Bacteroidales bacterium]|nr:leucine-rich repeat domain-containing protein [Bacteroidales bacterium]
MSCKDLHKKLLDAYSIDNLNRISLTLINLYKNHSFSTLGLIAELINDFTPVRIEPNGKGFYKLMMLYHPDRASFHRNEINRRAATGNMELLQEYAHILSLENLEDFAKDFESQVDIDFTPVYEWDFDTDGFTIENTLNSKRKQQCHTKPALFSFYDAVKLRQYGTLERSFPYYYLEDFDEYELSSSGINNLEGVQYCLHVKTLDLSDNSISDLSLLEELTYIEELNLSDNQLRDIDSIRHLTKLKRLFLSGNKISDLSPLFELPLLEYVDISGNDADNEQIRVLVDNDVKVDFDK